MVEQLDRFSFSLKKLTVIVLDKARRQPAKEMTERIEYGQERGLYRFYLPTSSPRLKIAEIAWRKVKYEWLAASDYEARERWRYAVKQARNEFGKSLRINFAEFNDSLT